MDQIHLVDSVGLEGSFYNVLLYTNTLNVFLSTEAEAAVEALNGRYFGGRTVRAYVYDQDLFDHADLSG